MWDRQRKTCNVEDAVPKTTTYSKWQKRELPKCSTQQKIPNGKFKAMSHSFIIIIARIATTTIKVDGISNNLHLFRFFLRCQNVLEKSTPIPIMTYHFNWRRSWWDKNFLRQIEETFVQNNPKWRWFDIFSATLNRSFRFLKAPLSDAGSTELN